MSDQQSCFDMEVQTVKPQRLIGWLLVVVGATVALSSAYQTWGQDFISRAKQNQVALEYGPSQAPGGSSTSKQVAKKFVDPQKATHLADIFAKMYIPRLGSNWNRLVAEGVRWHPVLNDIGIGHYPSTQMPGEIGNFAVAAHRGGFGGAFRNIHRLRAGDHVYVQTNQGWFSYVYLQTKIVKPTNVGVLAPVPKGLKGAAEGGKYLTLTSCNPIFKNTTRIIVWMALDETRTLAQGPPPSLARMLVD
jgi:sortase A